ncbi:tubulin domain-containing protein [Chytriomyces sp. MP71]|nr:tubulin domain-containing protein [Chytriomyces sp. MP71]
MKEIVTLQLGHSSSFVGTHLWNALDVSDHYIDKNTLMRSGLDAESGLATYAPRLVIVDLKGSLGSLKRINQLYENAQDQEHVAWNGKVHVSRQDAAPKNEYLTYLESEEAMDEDDPKQPLQDQPPKPQKQFAKALDSSVQVWSDFNSMFYHPRTVVELGSYSHGDTVAPFAIYNQGADLWTQDHALQEEVLEDRIRFFLEECDSPQGIQVLADVSNAFAGFTAACLESLREDVGKMCVTVFGVSDDCDSVTEPVKNFNEALALARVTEFSSLYVPVRKPRSGKPYRGSDFGGFGVKSNLQSRYHWTACLAAAIDTITLPTRVATNSVSLSAVLHPVASAGPLGMLASSVPFPFSSANTVKELFSRELNVGDHVDWLHDATFDEPFDVMEECEGQVSVLRGISGYVCSCFTNAVTSLF